MIKIRLNNDRKILSIETDKGKMNINGGSHAEYIQYAKFLGVEVEFSSPPAIPAAWIANKGDMNQ